MSLKLGISLRCVVPVVAPVVVGGWWVGGRLDSEELLRKHLTALATENLPVTVSLS